jgi:hypothetical protein
MRSVRIGVFHSGTHFLPQDKGRSILWNVVIFVILMCYGIVQTVSFATLSWTFVFRRINWFISVCLIGADIGQICRTFCITAQGASCISGYFTPRHDLNMFSTFILIPAASDITFRNRKMNWILQYSIILICWSIGYLFNENCNSVHRSLILGFYSGSLLMLILLFNADILSSEK